MGDHHAQRNEEDIVDCLPHLRIELREIGIRVGAGVVGAVPAWFPETRVPTIAIAAADRDKSAMILMAACNKATEADTAVLLHAAVFAFAAETHATPLRRARAGMRLIAKNRTEVIHTRTVRENAFGLGNALSRVHRKRPREPREVLIHYRMVNDRGLKNAEEGGYRSWPADHDHNHPGRSGWRFLWNFGQTVNLEYLLGNVSYAPRIGRV
jgi:hypothetical protein